MSALISSTNSATSLLFDNLKIQKGNGEKHVFIRSEVSLTYAYQLNSKSVMRRALSLAIVHQPSAKTRTILLLTEIYAIYGTVSVYTKLKNASIVSSSTWKETVNENTTFPYIFSFSFDFSAFALIITSNIHGLKERWSQTQTKDDGDISSRRVWCLIWSQAKRCVSDGHLWCVLFNIRALYVSSLSLLDALSFTKGVLQFFALVFP